jgi:glycosyl transferase family 25
MDRIEKIYIINLKHRTDRLQHILEELERINIHKDKVEIIEAVYEPKFGALGCSKSHLLTLEKFISSNYKNCLILEDDFTFTKDRKYIDEKLNYVMDNLNWDVILLAGNILKIEEDIKNNIAKIIDVQTASGYIINKNFAPFLLNNYNESVFQLQNIYNKVLENNKLYDEEIHKYTYYRCLKLQKDILKIPKLSINDFKDNLNLYCLDMNWKKIQPNNNWFILYPPVGIQYSNFSDINKNNVDYKC